MASRRATDALAAAVAVAFVAARAARRERRRAEQAEAQAARLVDAAAQLDAIQAERRRLEEEAQRVQVLERVDEQRSALLRSVSHDLRTPLATIKAAATELRDEPSHDAATRNELLELVCHESERLNRLVGNLLSMSRIEAGSLQPHLQAVDLDELVVDRVRRLGGMFDHVRLQLDVPQDLPLVDGDYSQLDQLVTNLLENAARYAPPRSTVWVSGHTRGDKIELRVADEGIGIPPHEAKRVFEPFHRGQGSTSSGLGLAICKGIVDAHRGSIAVERTPGGGATFVVRLPMRDRRLDIERD